MATTSGTYSFHPTSADMVVEAFERIQIYPPALTIEHVASARRSLNLILTEVAGDTGVNLWSVDQINVPLTPGVGTFVLPENTIDLLDVYLRTFTPGTATQTLGNALTAVVMIPGKPSLGVGGEPVVVAPGSGVFSVTTGSQIVTMTWPAHGQQPGQPIFWQTPIYAGTMTLPPFCIVDSVIDANTITFLAGQTSTVTRPNTGGTPLFTTTVGTDIVTVVQPGHGLTVGAMTPNYNFETVVGGVTVLAQQYEVVSVVSSYEYTIQVASDASSTATKFLNNGQIELVTQSPGVVFTDIPLFPISRTDYASLPYKATPGRPTSFWLDRVVPPQVTIYPISPPPNSPIVETAPGLTNPGATSVQYYGFMAFRMRELQDSLAAGGDQPDMPKRILPALGAKLAAALAEKWKPELWVEKLTVAERVWQQAMERDQERVSTHIYPIFTGYYN
jgi:hypothetical protein